MRPFPMMLSMRAARGPDFDGPPEPYDEEADGQPIKSRYTVRLLPPVDVAGPIPIDLTIAPLRGWEHSLEGDALVKLSENFYKITVPSGGSVPVTIRIEAQESSRPSGSTLLKTLLACLRELRESRAAK